LWLKIFPYEWEKGVKLGLKGVQLAFARLSWAGAVCVANF
jgi:hypothetical protein